MDGWNRDLSAEADHVRVRARELWVAVMRSDVVTELSVTREI